MEFHALVRPEHLNHHGSLFGGVLLKWVDEFAWIAATRQFPGCRFVTIAMESIVFKRPVPNGSILRFDIRPVHVGTTSVRFEVVVFATPPDSGDEKRVFSTHVTFVSVDDTGAKRPIVR